MKRRRDRAKNFLVNEVIAMCMDSFQVWSDFDSYLKKDVNIAIDINMLLDDCRNYLCVRMRRK